MKHGEQPYFHCASLMVLIEINYQYRSVIETATIGPTENPTPASVSHTPTLFPSGRLH